MKREYKVLEIIWFYNLNFEQEYCGTFNTLEAAQKYVQENTKEWEKDLDEYAEIGIGIEIETWEDDDMVDTYTEWCKDK